MGAEKEIENKVCKFVWENLGIKASKLSIIGDTSFPDRIFWVPGGKPIFIEFKAPKEKPKIKQSKTHTYLRDLNYNVEVFDNARAAILHILETLESETLSISKRKILVRARKRCPIT